MERKPHNHLRRVTSAELRKIFNEGQYTERVATGKLRLIVKKSRVTQMTEIKTWIPGTESQELHFLDKAGEIVVKAHRFLRPDGQLAASGLVDPKRIFLNGEWYGLNSPEGH
jgi:hypothetical protein